MPSLARREMNLRVRDFNDTMYALENEKSVVIF